MLHISSKRKSFNFLAKACRFSKPFTIKLLSIVKTLYDTVTFLDKVYIVNKRHTQPIAENKRIILLSLLLFFALLLTAYHFYNKSNTQAEHIQYNARFSSDDLCSKNQGEAALSPMQNQQLPIELTHTVVQSHPRLLVKSKPTWRLEGNFKTHFEKLLEKSKSGNLESKYIIAQNLKYCLFSPKNDDQLNTKLEQLTQFSDASISIDTALNQFSYCKGLSDDETKAYYAYLEDAARNGFVPAQETFANIHAEFFMKSQNITTENRALYIATRDKFKKQRLEFLQHASQHGSEKAIMALSNLYYTQQQSDEHSFAKSYALNKLIMEITDNDDIYNRYSFYEQKQYLNMSEEEIEYADAMVEQWLQIIKTNGTLYPSNK
ncbi:hypothetical protein JF50_18540 [Pseudoalteromonas luteoviolacea]|uniref:Sel1 repeat family protein n=1 Tax=Pseudoalteromonas luteoviolacea TaxID=43657 RepID=A0A0C1QMH4_9GAMM|nr:hypothetical protein JF50_18540 [Pseudoalteromonas luteoviolacea]